MESIIRKLLPDESSAYRNIRLECLKKYPNTFGSNYQDELKKHKLFFQTHVEEADKNNFVVGAFKENELIGISGFNRFEGEKMKHRGRIIQVFVKPKFQGQSIGSTLVNETIKLAFNLDGIEQIEIGVLSSNKGAESVYKKLGFKEFGVQKNYLKVGARYFDHIMMEIYKN